jgi:hypothetical protein
MYHCYSICNNCINISISQILNLKSCRWLNIQMQCDHQFHTMWDLRFSWWWWFKSGLRGYDTMWCYRRTPVLQRTLPPLSSEWSVWCQTVDLDVEADTRRGGNVWANSKVGEVCPWRAHWQVSPTFLLAHAYFCPSNFLLLHLGPLPGTMHFTLKVEATRSSKTLVFYSNTKWCPQLKI